MKMYLIRFVFDNYCQGYEDATDSVLVYATDFWSACDKIQVKYRRARDFVNLTIE
jgi:hypothetical protein